MQNGPSFEPQLQIGLGNSCMRCVSACALGHFLLLLGSSARAAQHGGTQRAGSIGGAAPEPPRRPPDGTTCGSRRTSAECARTVAVVLVHSVATGKETPQRQEEGQDRDRSLLLLPNIALKKNIARRKIKIDNGRQCRHAALPTPFMARRLDRKNLPQPTKAPEF